MGPLLVTAAVALVGAGASVSGARVSAAPAPSVTLTGTPVAGGRSAYVVAFGVPGGMPARAGVSVLLPAGSIVDDTTQASMSDDGVTVGACRVSAPTAVDCLLAGGTPVAAGDTVAVTLGGVVNPPAGAYSLTVATNSIASPVMSAAYLIAPSPSPSRPAPDGGPRGGRPAVAAGPVVSVAPSSAAGALAGYAITFKVISPGGVRVTFPPGTGLGSLDGEVLDRGAVVGSCPPTTALVLSCAIPGVVAAGDELSVALRGVVNPPAGSYVTTVATAGGSAPVASLPYAITAARQLSDVAVALSDPRPGAAGVTYVISSFTSSSGAVSASAKSSVRALLAPGTDLTGASGSLYDGGAMIGPCQLLADPVGATCSLSPGQTTRAGDSLSVVIRNVTNPGVTPDAQSYLSTTSDVGLVASAPYSVTSSPTTPGAAPTPVSVRIRT